MWSRIIWPKILVHCAFLHFIAIMFNILWRFFTHSFYILGTYAYYKRWICSMTSLSAWWPVTWSICIFCSSLLSPCSLFLWLISFYSRFTLNFVNDNKFYTKNLGFFFSIPNAHIQLIVAVISKIFWFLICSAWKYAKVDFQSYCMQKYYSNQSNKQHYTEYLKN